MNNSTTKSIVAVLVAAAVIGGIYYWATNKSGGPSYNPPAGGGQNQPAAAPVVKTKAVSFVSQSTAVLNGEVNPNGAQTSYWYEYGTTQSLGSVAGAQLLGAGRGTYQAPTYITGLAANTKYYFRITAINSVGKTSGSILSFTTNNTVPPAYDSPDVTTRAANDVTTSSGVLNGEVNPNSARTDYWFEYGETTSLGDTTSVRSAGAGNADVDVSAKISGLAPNTVYYFRVNAQNGYGTDNGAIRSFRTKSENPPTPAGDQPTAETDSASNVTSSSATLSGQVDPNGAETTYYFEYGEAALLGIFSLDQKTDTKSAGAGTEFVNVSSNISGLNPDTTYYFRLVAENKYGTDAGAIFRFRTEN